MATLRNILATIRVRLLLLAVLAVLPMLALTLYTGYEQRQQAIVRAQENALSVARLAASDQARLIEGSRQLLVAMARFPAVREYDVAACSEFMADLMAQNPLYSNLGAALPNGDVFCTAVPSPTQINCGDRPFFQQVLQIKDFVVGNYVTMRITGKPGIAAVYPVLDAARTSRAVVFASIDLTWLDGFVAQAQLPEGSALTLVDRSGTVLTRYPDPETWRGQSLPAEQAQLLLSQPEGLSEGAGFDGVERLYAFTRLSCGTVGDLYVRVGIPKEMVLADATRILNRNLIALFAAMLLAFALAGTEGHTLVLRPLNTILKAVRRLDAGDFKARVGRVPRSRELDDLARAFDQMVATMEAREAERDASEEELRQQTARAEALAVAAARLNAQLDLDGVLRAVCQEASHTLGIQVTCVGLYDEREGALHRVTHCGTPDSWCERLQDAWEALQSQLLEQRSDASQEEVVALGAPMDSCEYAGDEALAMFGIPMLRDGRLIGVIIVSVEGETRQLIEEDTKFLRAISDMTAQAVNNATLYESLQREERRRADLLRGLISAQEDERKRLARELHDETSQGITALMVGLESADLALASGSDEAGAQLQSTKSIARKMLVDIRRLVGDLRPSLLDDLGLVPAITWYAKQRLAPLGTQLDLQCDFTETRLPPEYETALFRIVQEAITNVVKHSDASEVQIDMHALNGEIVLRVADNGQGFQMQQDAGGTVRSEGFGLMGIQERVSILGGGFSVQTSPGQGTVIEVHVPLVL